MARKAVPSKTESLSRTRAAGLDLCEAMMLDLCSRGLLAVTPAVLSRLQEQERSLQSHKLRRFASEVAAIRSRFEEGLRRGAVDASVIADRLARLQMAVTRLRSLLADPLADPQEIEELAGKTWRETDLEKREDFPLAEMAWESLRIEEGFRVDTSYLLGRGGIIYCERKIIPVGLRAAVDDTPKPQRPGLRRYPLVGIFPGDLPRRVKLIQVAGAAQDVDTTHPSPGQGSAAPSSTAPFHGQPAGGGDPGWREGEPILNVHELLPGAPQAVEDLQHAYRERRSRPFPPDTLPLLLHHPRIRVEGDRWWIAGNGSAVLESVPPPGSERQPPPRAVFQAFQDAVLYAPMDAILLLLHDKDDAIAAAPVGAVTPDGIIRFGLDG